MDVAEKDKLEMKEDIRKAIDRIKRWPVELRDSGNGKFYAYVDPKSKGRYWVDNAFVDLLDLAGAM